MSAGLYLAAKVGPTGSIAFDAVTPVTKDIESWVRSCGVELPVLLLLRSTAKVYVRQSGVANPLAATSSDFTLFPVTLVPLTVDAAATSRLSVLGVSDSGTLFVTIVSSLGNGAASGAIP